MTHHIQVHRPPSFLLAWSSWMIRGQVSTTKQALANKKVTAMSIDSLENIMADYQFKEAKAQGFDLDPSDVYAFLFKELDWSPEEIAEAIGDMETSLEARLLETVVSDAYADVLLHEAAKAVLDDPSLRGAYPALEADVIPGMR